MAITALKLTLTAVSSSVFRINALLFEIAGNVTCVHHPQFPYSNSKIGYCLTYDCHFTSCLSPLFSLPLLFYAFPKPSTFTVDFSAPQHSCVWPLMPHACLHLSPAIWGGHTPIGLYCFDCNSWPTPIPLNDPFQAHQKKWAFLFNTLW